MYQEILVAIDLNDLGNSQKIIATAVEYACHFGSTLHVMTVSPRFDMPLVASFFPADYEQKLHAEMDKQLHGFVAQYVPSELKKQTIVATGSVYEEILHNAEKLGCDLIVMGRSGKSHSKFLLGSNATHVVHHAEMSVLIV